MGCVITWNLKGPRCDQGLVRGRALPTVPVPAPSTPASKSLQASSQVAAAVDTSHVTCYRALWHFLRSSVFAQKVLSPHVLVLHICRYSLVYKSGSKWCVGQSPFHLRVIHAVDR